MFLVIFLSTYLGSNFIAYPLISVALFRHLRIYRRIDPLLIYFIVGAFLFGYLKGVNNSLLAVFLTLKYFYGFILFYMYFRFSNRLINVSQLIYVLFIAIALEALLINTILPPTFWMNYPIEDGFIVNTGAFWGFYFRPYSIGANASVTAVIMVVLYAVELSCSSSVRSRSRIIVPLSLVLLLSGEGFLLYLFLILFSYKQGSFARTQFQKFIAILFVTVLISLNFIFQDINIFEKLDYSYIQDLVILKLSQSEVSNISLTSDYEFLIGAQLDASMNLPFGGDIGFINLIENSGLYTFVFYTILILSSLKNKAKLPLAILVLSNLHYSALFCVPGQVLFGYILAGVAKKRLH